MNGIRIALIFAVLIFSGYLASELGITHDPINSFTAIPQSPNGNGFFNVVTTILAPLLWVYDALSSFFQILTFSADIPTFVNGLIVAPIAFFMLYTLLKLVRGGG